MVRGLNIRVAVRVSLFQERSPDFVYPCRQYIVENFHRSPMKA